MSNTSIRAWKPTEDGKNLVVCEKTDELAEKYDVSFPGMVYASSVLTYDNLHDAEEVQRALERCFEAGKKYKLAELRKFIGVE